MTNILFVFFGLCQRRKTQKWYYSLVNTKHLKNLLRANKWPNFKDYVTIVYSNTFFINIETNSSFYGFPLIWTHFNSHMKYSSCIRPINAIRGKTYIDMYISS